ncbi:hypothetical protein LMG7974_01585 [Campylobacter majalis]|uniref:Uncharacterized protein n=1 Tax=Campylobacter majalis TaxID=2790656 RepID=A0ABM8Q9H9_9BACT|nr:hypothetical protein [Campylobacter majalis]CAD7289508.1 hypothetical protein LMG7974_01585 [Campylobacter majalis]
MIDLQQEYANQNNPALQAGKKLANSTKNIFSTFSENCKSIMANLDQQKIGVHNDDTLNDKTLFAFLADLLKSFKDNRNELLKELARNEELSKDKLDLILKEELKKNEFLSEENKKNIEEFLNSELGGDITKELVVDKVKQIENFKREAQERGIPKDEIEQKLQDPRFSIRPSDIARVDVKNPKIKEELQKVEQAVKKVVLKK